MAELQTSPKTPLKLPKHLSRYVVSQNYGKYTDIDQAVWRFIMRRLKHYLVKYAHECYAEGLEKTGITTEHIPKIEEMSEKLSQFGWTALAVSGFIPPAAFMELQSLGVLPIACDIRALEHAMYTPAPDIVHEAAGHAPILISPEFAEYLTEYAQVARKAILNHEDLDIYAAIRELSDLKEDPAATPAQVVAANKKLEQAAKAAVEPSEAALLARMNWWTAEYGLIGDLENPKIYGAGLLSSVGESYTALLPTTKKIPFSLDCLNFTYDITEPQPQLFVTPDFKTLTRALRDMAKTMAFTRGGVFGLETAKKSRTINAIEFNSGIQISGQLKTYFLDAKSEGLSIEKQIPIYLQLEGPCQLAVGGAELPGQGRHQHAHGFGTPVGLIVGAAKCLSDWTDSELAAKNLVKGHSAELTFISGVRVKGRVTEVLKRNSKIVVITWTDCTVIQGDRQFFNPEWGSFDMAVGSKVVSVFGGAADRETFGESEDFEAKIVPEHRHPPEYIALNEIYSRIRKVREGGPVSTASAELEKIIGRLMRDFPTDWLSRLEILEVCKKHRFQPKGLADVEAYMSQISSAPTTEGVCVKDGMALIEKDV